MIARTLTLKTTLRFATLVTVTTALVLTAGGWLLDRQMRRGLSLLHEGEARELAEYLEGAAATPQAVRERVQRDTEGDAEVFFVQIHNEEGAVLFRSANLGAAVLPDLSPGVSREVLELPGVGGIQLSEIRVDGWHIQVASPLTMERLLLTDYAKVSAGLVLAAAVAGLALGYGFSRVTLRPIRLITETAQRIGGDNLRERIPQPGARDELAALSRVLNQTFDRLESSFEQVRRFSADASHELKTPLALMRLNAERLRTQLVSERDQAALDDLLEAVDRMQTVVERLLFLARAEGGALSLELKPVDLAHLIENFAEDAGALLEEAGAKFAIKTCAEGTVRGDAALLRQLLMNLVGNAARVAPRGSMVEIEARRAETGWTLVLSDEGPGLPAEQLERVFGRFVRFEEGANSGGERSAGHGLGLAICRSIVHLHGGEIYAVNRDDGRTGLRVVVSLPA